MRKFARLSLTGLFLLVFVVASFAAPKTVNQSSVANANAIASPLDERAPVQNELDELVVLYNFEVADINNWTWGANEFYSYQDSHWAADDYMPHNGSNSWRVFDPSFGTNGGYDNHWFQSASTPPMDLTGTENPSLSFWFRLVCETPELVDVPGYDGWDGANFMIRYTNDQGDVVTEVATGFTGPAYDGQSFFSYGYEWLMGPGVAAWGGTHAWSEVTMDLSGYTDYDDVQILFTFCSDPAWATEDEVGLSGFQIDDIAISDGETVLFIDNAEDPENTNFVFSGGVENRVENEFVLLDGQTDAPSPTRVLDIDHQVHGYSHYLESPEFSLPALETGERLYFELMVNSDMFAPGADDHFYPAWWLEIYDPEQEVWWNANNIRDILSATSFVGGTVGWTAVSSFGEEGAVQLEGTPLAGLDGVKARIFFRSYVEDYAFQFCRWDNLSYEIRGVQHDIATQILSIPYPVAVGLPNPGTVLYTNNGVESETFIAFWGVGVANIPGIPGPTLTLDAQESLVMTIDTPNNATTGWIPTAAQAGSTVNVIARASLGTDEDNTNDYDTTAVYVNNAGEYEFAYDNHSASRAYSMTNANTGPMTRFVMDQTNPYFSDVALDISDIGVYWFALPATRPNWPTGGVSYRIHIYEGGNSPGAELLNEEYTITSAEAQGEMGWTLVDVSGIEALQNVIAADFYVWAEFTNTVSNGTADVIQPSIIADENNTGELYPGNNLFFNGTDVSEAGFASFIHVLATETLNSADEPIEGTIPGTYALEEAYPNPFNPTTTLRYDVARTGQISLKVFNVMGQEVASLVDRQVRAGSHVATFDASALSSGVYFVRMQADGFNAVRKVMLMK